MADGIRPLLQTTTITQVSTEDRGRTSRRPQNSEHVKHHRSGTDDPMTSGCLPTDTAPRKVQRRANSGIATGRTKHNDSKLHPGRRPRNPHGKQQPQHQVVLGRMPCHQTTNTRPSAIKPNKSRGRKMTREGHLALHGLALGLKPTREQMSGK